MGTIQTTTGLVTGLDIAGLVDKLMEISSAGRDALQERTDALLEKEVAIATLGSLVYSTKVSVLALGNAQNYKAQKATSSNSNALSATLSGTPANGTYEFTPLQTVQTQKYLSSGFKSTTEALGAGSISVRFGDNVERAASLSLINGGAGFTRGSIRIGDRSGAVATIDLSTARSVDDVLGAINNETGINVTASTRDGKIVLTDNTGQTAANLTVSEVSRGRTAASLGLSGIDTASDVGVGSDIYGLFGDLDLDYLNDGAGVAVSSVLPDIEYTLRDGTTGTIDFSPLNSGESDDTVQKVIDRIESDSDGKLQVEIAADGRRLTVTDTTEGTVETTLTALNDSTALADLGLDTASVDGVIIGDRILGGLRTVSLSSLNGGQGFGELGTIQLTDRSGASAMVDLSGAETLEGLVEAISAAGVGIRAQINAAANGIELIDTSGGTDGNLIIADADETNTATKLQIAADEDASTVNSGDLHLQIISRSTRLSALNGGAGIANGRFTIADSTGRKASVTVNSSAMSTVGDVIDAINRLGINVAAEVNATGDGILLRDTGGGAGTLAVSEGSSTTAANLGLLKKATTVEGEEQTEQQIDGSMTYTITIDANDTLDDLQEKINDLGAGFSASVLSDGSVRPWRMSLVSDRAGLAGSMVVDTSQVGFDFAVSSEAQDALLAYGAASTVSSALLVTSNNNTFNNLVDGMSLTIGEATGGTVSVTVSTSYTKLKVAAESFVENYNLFREQYNELTAYDAAEQKGSLLTGDLTVMRMEMELTSLATGTFHVDGQYILLEQVGICFEEDGTLSFNETVFDAAIAYDPEAMETLFTAKDIGVAGRFTALIERLASSEKDSLLSRRLEAMDSRIADSEERIKRMNTSLERERTRLLTSLYNMEIAVSKIQSNLDALDSIQWITDQYRAKK